MEPITSGNSFQDISKYGTISRLVRVLLYKLSFADARVFLLQFWDKYDKTDKVFAYWPGYYSVVLDFGENVIIKR